MITTATARTRLTHIVLTVLAACMATLALVHTAHAGEKVAKPKSGGGEAGSSIIGGYYPHPSQWPWMAAIMDTTRGNDDFRRQFCGGTLVHARLVATAAHCLVDKRTGAVTDKANLHVLLGKRRLSAPGGEHIGIARIEIHPAYNILATGHAGPDVALLLLDRPSSQQPALLHSPSVPVHQGNVVTSMGWGRTRSGDTYVYDQQRSDDLKAIDFAVWSDENCRNAGRDQRDAYFYRTYSASNEICAGYADSSDTTCNGDSGSPMMIKDTASQWRLLGVVSWGGIGCYGGYSPTVFAWVGGSSIHRYISQGIAAAARLGSVPSTTSSRPASTRIRLSAALSKLHVRRGRPVRIRVRSSAGGELNLKVTRKRRSLGIWAVDIDKGRTRIALATRTGRRKFKRGTYRLHLWVLGANGSRSNRVTLAFRVR